MFVLRAAGFIATSTFGASPGVRMSWSAKWSWKPETPGSEPAGARISAGKSGNVAMSLPIAAVSEVNCPPVSCIPSPESPAKRMITWGSCSTGFVTLQSIVASLGEDAGPDGARGAAHDLLDEPERDEPEQQAGEGCGRDRERVEPERHTLLRREVDHVGEDVRRVRKEQQPAGGEDGEQRRLPAAARGVVERKRQHERDPREEQVPQQVPESEPARVVHAR